MNNMKAQRMLIYIVTVVFALISHGLINVKTEKENSFLKMKIEKKKNAEPTFGNPHGAMEFYYAQRAYPKGKIPAGWRQKAFEHIKKFNVQLQKSSGAKIGEWTELGPDNIGGRIRAIAINPSNTSIIYAGSVSGGVWKSTDAGSSWFPVGDKMANLAVCSLVLDPANPDIIYAGTGEGFFNYDALRGDGIFKSTDAGASWSRLGSTKNENFYYVNKLVFDESTNTLWAGTRKGLFKSTNGGNSFTTVLSGQNNGNVHCTDIEILNSSPSKIFVSFGLFNQSVIYRSTDGGQTFANNYSQDNHGRIEISVSTDNNYVYASFMSLSTNGVGKLAYSSDGGDTWSEVAVPGPTYSGSDNYGGSQAWYNNILAVDPNNPGNVFAGGIDLWKSTDSGNTWNQISNWYSAPGYQFIHADHHAIAFDPKNPDIVYIGTDGGVYKSTDGGVNWSAKNNGLAVTQFYYGAVDQTSDKFYGGTQDNGTLKSTGSSTWSEIMGGDGGATEVNFNNPNVIFMEYVNLALFKSTDGGTTFNKSMTGIPAGSNFWDGTTDRVQFIAPFEMDINNPSYLVAGTYKVYRTTDGGTLWNAISGDLTTGGDGSSGPTISTVTVAVGNSNVIYAGCSNGVVQVTKDAGGSWTNISAGLPDLYCTKIRTSWVSQGTAVASFSGYNSGQKVYKTTDYGTTWTNISGNLPNIPVNALLINPADDNIILAGTDLGVFLTKDNGTDWQLVNDGMPNVSVMDLDYRNMDDMVFAATHGRGMFKASFSELTGVENTTTVPDKFMLSQNYPNPFNPSTKIAFNLPKAANAHLVVYDALGREVAEIVNDFLSEGRHEYTFTANNLASGMYIYQLKTKNYTAIKKMILLK